LFVLLLVAACGDDSGATGAGGAAFDGGDPFANANGSSVPGSSITPGQGGAGCLTEFALCELASTRCCGGLDCVVDPELGTRCRAPCERDGQCDAVACVEGGVGAATYCAYSGAGDSPATSGECGEAEADCDERRPCCACWSCVTAEGSELDGCQPACTANEDCDSGCCRRAADRPNGFCAPARVCGCGEQGAACSGFEPACCEAFACTTDTGESASCKPVCQDGGDCESACCAPISGTDQSVCVASERCG
jgi:hypothetical protein